MKQFSQHFAGCVGVNRDTWPQVENKLNQWLLKGACILVHCSAISSTFFGPNFLLLYIYMEVLQCQWRCHILYQLDSEVWYAHQQLLLMQKYVRNPNGKDIANALENKPTLQSENRIIIRPFNAFD